MSGRAGRYVYYWAYGHLCWRAYVVPKDPRTAVQQRSRAAFAAASKAWSASQSLTEEQRDAWHADAAKIKSTPRLGQSGPLTAQHDFVGRNSLKERWGLALLLKPRGRGKEEGRMRKAESRICHASPASSESCATLLGYSPGMRRTCAVRPRGGRSQSPESARQIRALASAFPPAPYATLLGPPPYHLHTPSGAMPAQGAVCPPRRQHGFARMVVQPAPSPSKGPLSRTLSRQLG
jgi:hypothetical protein